MSDDLPGSGASFGNAGTIATYACVPVNNPDIVTSRPSQLSAKEISRSEERAKHCLELQYENCD